MRVTFWGTRGSIAKAGPTTLRYGGNTSCVEVRSDGGTLLVIDCGTGAHGLGIDLMARAGSDRVDGHILISHTHWDHIQGLPFFTPLTRPGSSWQIYGPRGLGGSLSETLAGQMQYSYFPVTVDQLAAEVEYHDLVEGSFQIDDVRVHTHYLNHPALTLGYRIEVDGATLVYASDHEPHRRELAAGGDIDASRHDRIHAEFVAGADLLIHDAQYLASEYPQKVGWGHSTVEYVIDAARAGGVAQVALYHHDPTRTDDQIDVIVARAADTAAQVGYGGQVFGAAEGMTIELRGDSPTVGASRGSARPSDALAGVARSVLLAVSSPEIAKVLRQAAEAEELEVWQTGDREEAVEIVRAKRPGIVVLEDTGDGSVLAEFARALRTVDPPVEGEISLIAVTATGGWPPGADDLTITDSLVWPSSTGYIRTKMRSWLLRQACRWQAAPLAEDESARLRAVSALHLLDTAPEPRFDRYTAMASKALGMPIALISLVDADRQWFKSHHGLDATETPREMAFCAHAILGDEPLQVIDALADDRFADNPLVAADPHVRFYAGVPLTLADGTRAGTLCVIDHRPRVLDDRQLDELKRLARLVEAELRLGHDFQPGDRAPKG